MELNRMLRWVITAGLFVVPFIPFVITQTMFFPFITGKNFTFRILIEIIFALWLLLMLRDAEARPKRSSVVVAVASFIGVITLASLFGENPYHSFWSNYERMEGIITHLHLLAYFVVLISVFKVGKIWDFFLHTFLLSGVLLSLYSLLQLAGVLTINQGGVRIDATFGNTIYLAVYMLFMMGIALFYFFRTETRQLYHYIYLFLAALFFAMIYYTATRGAIIGAFGGGFFALIILATVQTGKARKVSAGLLVAILLLLGGFYLMRNTAFVKESLTLSRFAKISLKDDTTRARLANAGIALKGFVENPILGWGTENYNLVFNKYYDPELYGQEQWFDRVHNIIFEWLVAGGLLGLLSFLGIFASAAYVLWRRQDNPFSLIERSLLVGLLIAYLIQDVFVFDNLMSYVMFLTILGYIHVRSSEVAPVSTGAISSKTTSFFNARPWLKNAVAPIVLVLLVASIYFVNVKPIQANRSLIKALTGDGKGYQGSLDSFERVFALNTFGTTEAREQLAQAAVQVAQAQNASDEVKRAFFEVTQREMQKELSHVPTTWRSIIGKETEKSSREAREYVITSAVYRAYGLPDQALALINRAIEISPTKQPLISDKALLLAQMARYPEAVETAKKAFMLETRSVTARMTYAATLIYNNQVSEAETLLLEHYGTAPVTDEMIMLAYNQVGQYAKAAAIAEARVEGHPNNMQYRLTLAALYMQLNRRADAIKQLEETIRIEPGFKDQGDFYISEIRAGRNP